MNLFKENKNKLILGDCLEVMKKMEAESIDLIYLDPPFFSNKNYEVIWGDEGEIRSFQDRWAGGIGHYIGWLYDRVKEMHRILKPTGSIYLHCDWHADAYIRVQILDEIFGVNNFRGDIVWQRTNAHNDAKNKLAVLSDTIWYYSKTDKSTFYPIYKNYEEDYIKKAYKNIDSRGRYKLNDISGPRINPNDKEWKGYHPKTIGRSWAVTNESVIRIVGEEKAKTLSINEKLDLLYENGYIEFSKNGIPKQKRYLELSEVQGTIVGNIWVDIYRALGNERIGYPTQKPLALLDRIIKASSNEGDIVLDPFMGGGTTMVMASRLGRRFIGIDQSVAAVDVSSNRLYADRRGQKELEYSTHEIEKYYYAEEDLRAMDPFKFESWIIEKFGGIPNTKQTGDGGKDGEKDGVPIQVKRHKNNIGRVDIQKFHSACMANRLYNDRKKSGLPVGYFIAFGFAKEAVEELARFKRENGVIIEKVPVDTIVPVAKKPVVNIEWEETEDGKYKFTATSESSIINFSWDFEYGVPAYKHPEQTAKFNPTVLYDTKGVRVHNFAMSGSHNIAVKVVDDKLLENIAVCSINI